MTAEPVWTHASRDVWSIGKFALILWPLSNGWPPNSWESENIVGNKKHFYMYYSLPLNIIWHSISLISACDDILWWNYLNLGNACETLIHVHVYVCKINVYCWLVCIFHLKEGYNLVSIVEYNSFIVTVVYYSVNEYGHFITDIEYEWE